MFKGLGFAGIGFLRVKVFKGWGVLGSERFRVRIFRVRMFKG